jgi:RNA polymerase sigma-70 factor (ECF subfamily)
METIKNLPEELQQLISECARGSRFHQAQLYNMYCRRMMGVCLWYSKNKEEAEEILQDGFMRVFVYIHTFTGEGSLEGWIRKIMVNAALLRYRNKGNHLWIKSAYNAELHDRAEAASFFSNYDEKELLKLVQSLPAAYRIIFNLYVLEGFKHKEIASMLGISEGTSKSNLADARAILQKKVYELQKIGS